jgi:hypothetical protein
MKLQFLGQVPRLLRRKGLVKGNEILFGSLIGSSPLPTPSWRLANFNYQNFFDEVLATTSSIMAYD